MLNWLKSFFLMLLRGLAGVIVTDPGISLLMTLRESDARPGVICRAEKPTSCGVASSSGIACLGVIKGLSRFLEPLSIMWTSLESKAVSRSSRPIAAGSALTARVLNGP